MVAQSPRNRQIWSHWWSSRNILLAVTICIDIINIRLNVCNLYDFFASQEKFKIRWSMRVSELQEWIISGLKKRHLFLFLYFIFLLLRPPGNLLIKPLVPTCCIQSLFQASSFQAATQRVVHDKLDRFWTKKTRLWRLFWNVLCWQNAIWNWFECCRPFE